ncbi:MAG: amidohydrolase family protein, partial [Arenimonas sp.]
GTLKNSDVLVQGGIIRAIGSHLSAPGIVTVDAKGKPLTPGLFAGLGDIGLEEVSAEKSTVDSSFNLGEGAQKQMRPEFDVVPAFNPNSMLIPITRLEGFTFTAISANAGSSLIGGQGAIMRLNGQFEDPIGSRILFASMGSGADELSGSSRAAQYMLLDQAIREARGLSPYAYSQALLTPAGREALNKFLLGGRTVFRVERAADIRQVLSFAKKNGMRPIIVGGTEAWQVAAQLKADNVVVFVDALENLPASFDQLGSRMDNAAILQKAGVRVGLYRSDDASQNARKLRQVAGNAVSYGMPWEAGLAAITSVPADAFGVGDKVGRIEVGLIADLVLWNGDPLEVNAYAEQVWMRGQAMPMKSRQTELRDRYMSEDNGMPRAYTK